MALPGVDLPPVVPVFEEDDDQRKARMPPWIVTLVIVLLVAAPLVAMAVKPVSFFGFDDESLSSSLARAVGEPHARVSCETNPPGSYGPWRCEAEADGGFDSPVVYDLSPGSRGCWTAQGAGRTWKQVESLTGCVNAEDLIRAIG